jgi:hypothetical protein
MSLPHLQNGCGIVSFAFPFESFLIEIPLSKSFSVVSRLVIVVLISISSSLVLGSSSSS